MLISIGIIGTIVKSVRNTVTVLVIIRVASVSKSVLIPVSLVFVPVIRTIVANISKTISIRVLLVQVRNKWAVVPLVEDAIIVLVRIAGISKTVLVSVLLVQVLDEGTVVTSVAPEILSTGVCIHLVRVGHQRTIVRGVGDTVIVSVVITRVSDAVTIAVLLSRVGGVDTVVHPTSLILTSDVKIRPPIQISIRSTELTIARPSDFTFAHIVTLAKRLNTVRILITLRPIRTDAGPVGAPDVLVTHKAADAGAAVEGAISVNTHRVLDAAPVVLIALIDVVTNLLLSRRKVQAHSREASAASKARGTGAAPEAGDEVIARGRHVTRVCEVTLIQVIATSSISGKTSRTGSALVVGGVVDVVTLHVSEAGRGMPLTNVWHTVDAVAAETLGAGAALIIGILNDGVAGHSLKAGLVTTGVSLAVAAIPLVSRGAGPALWTLHSVTAVNTWRSLKTGIRQICTHRLGDLTRLAVHQSLPQQNCLLFLGLDLQLQPPESLNQLLKGGNQQPVSLVKVEQGDVASAVGVEISI